jgi:BlaI family transcriptional regulator, penicillinase repressor
MFVPTTRTMKVLTKAEEQIMQGLWQIEQGTVADIIEQLPEPKPHYNTVSTVIKILIEKEFVSFTAFGRSHVYKAAITKDKYAKQSARQLLKNYFDGGARELMSFFIKERKLTATDIEEIMRDIENSK